jgi:hypothetical protein
LTLADALACESALLTASTVTPAGDGSTAGAVYTPPVEINPTAEFPPGTPFTFQETVESVAPVTVAWNVCVCPRKRFAFVGCTPTVTFEGPVDGELVCPHAVIRRAAAQDTANG